MPINLQLFVWGGILVLAQAAGVLVWTILKSGLPKADRSDRRRVSRGTKTTFDVERILRRPQVERRARARSERQAWLTL